MSITNPALQQLKDIHLPPPIHSWPMAPGWLCLYVCSIILFFYFIYCWYQRRKRRMSVSYALRQLKQLRIRMQENSDIISIASDISTLVRRTALSYFKREAVAGLSGQRWLEFLNESGETSQFTTEIGKLLIDVPYRKNDQSDLTDLLVIVENWLLVIAQIKKKGD